MGSFKNRCSRFLLYLYSLIMALVFGVLGFGWIFLFILCVGFRHSISISTPWRISIFQREPNQASKILAWLFYIFMACAVVWALVVWIQCVTEDVRDRRRAEEDTDKANANL